MGIIQRRVAFIYLQFLIMASRLRSLLVYNMDQGFQALNHSHDCGLSSTASMNEAIKLASAQSAE